MESPVENFMHGNDETVGEDCSYLEETMVGVLETFGIF
jgi:hypothetical protein